MQYSLIPAIGCNPIHFRSSIQPIFCLILIRTDELLSQGQKVYGYSLFAPDVTCTSKTVLNVANSCFPTNTGTNGGIDLVAPNLGAVFLENE